MKSAFFATIFRDRERSRDFTRRSRPKKKLRLLKSSRLSGFRTMGTRWYLKIEEVPPQEVVSS